MASGGDSDSNSSSTGEEERIRRLFQTCDGDGDGYIDSNDLLMICRRLHMEDSVEEIMQQLGADEQGRICYEEFLRCRMQLMREIDALQDGEKHLNEPWPTSSDNSLGVASGRQESWEFDSGARDLSPEPNTLQKLIEAAGGSITGGSANLLDLANKLHLAALASLKGEIIDLTNRLQHITHERDLLEKQLNKSQLERLHILREHDERLEQQAARYEERITELHSVIAELSKKIDRQQIHSIREEDEYSQSADSHNSGFHSNDTSNGNNVNESCSDKENEDLNAELSRVVTELESVVVERKRLPAESQLNSQQISTETDSIEERTLQACIEMEDLRQQQQISNHSIQLSQLQDEVAILRDENNMLQDQVGRQEAELNKTKASMGSIREERDRLRKKVRELQARLQGVQMPSPQGSHTSSPTRNHGSYVNPNMGDRSGSNHDEIPVAKIAERVKLKKVETGERHILGSQISSCGVANPKVAEHLVQSVQEDSSTQEIFQSLFSHGVTAPDSKIREFEVETERLNSRIEHLKSQNDLLNLTLEESKTQCDRLSVLIGKYESNNTALQLALSYSDQAIEAFEVLVALLESEQGLLLANCRAAGLGQMTGDNSNMVEEEITAILKRANDNRKTAENVAKHLLQRLDRSYRTVNGVGGTTSSTSSGCDSDFSKLEEQRLRDFIQQLKCDRASVRMTVLELESIHIDPLAKEPISNLDAQRLDLENAVLMQELMAMKEEKAELKAHVYLLDKEKGALELRLNSQEAQEQAYLVHIEHLKCEVQEQQQQSEKLKEGKKCCHYGDSSTVMLEDVRSHDMTQLSQELADALKREKKLKARIQELVSTLENVTKNSELRHQQSAEFVNDLKRANSALVAAFERSKKKHQGKLKKLEQQMVTLMERNETQVRMLKQRISLLEEENPHLSHGETSL